MKKLIKKAKNKKKGFTLVELIVVIAIIGILAMIIVPSVGKNIEKSKTAAVNASAKTLFTEASAAATDVIVNGDTLIGTASTTVTVNSTGTDIGGGITLANYFGSITGTFEVDFNGSGVTEVRYTESGITGTYTA